MVLNIRHSIASAPSGTPLPLLPWEGGSAFYASFSKAIAAGWTSTSFFPIGVWLSPLQDPHPGNLYSAGVNYYMAVEENADIFPLTNVTSHGVCVMPHMDYWTPTLVGTNTMATAWFTTDEPDMNDSYGNAAGRVAVVQNYAATARARADGRMVSVNIGNGVTESVFWTPQPYISQMIQSVDFASVDQYAYTSPTVRTNLSVHAPDWPSGVTTAQAQCSATYGWLADQMYSFQDPTHRRPFAVAVETAMPYLFFDGASAGTITIPQIEGACWAALIHEARSILFFQHNNDASIATYSLSGPEPSAVTIRAGVTAITAKIHALAPVLNTQTSIWNFGASGVDTMLKITGGFAYICAGIGFNGGTGSKTFTLPTIITGTSVEVVDESRILSITGARTFTDSFAAEYSHHVYKIAM